MKNKKGMSPTARVLAELRKHGYPAAIVERWNQWAKVRQDLFGFADILYLTPGSIVAIQATSGTNHAARRAKVLSEPRAAAWIKAGGLIEIWSVSKQGHRGKRKKWTFRKEELVESDFEVGHPVAVHADLDATRKEPVF